jgi:predicted MFS family arabinose efflux permease
LLTVFTVATAFSATAPNYWVLLVARVATALTHGMFWSVVTPTAAGLFAPRARARVVTIIFTGASLATVLGVPAGTWLGQHSGWRTSFWALAALGLLALVTVSALVPTSPPSDNHSASGTSPDARRYGVLVAVTALSVTGAFSAFTYISPFLTDVSGFSPGAIGPVLLVGGVAGIVGSMFAGAIVERFPRTATATPVAVLSLSMLGLWGLGTVQPVAVTMVGLWGFALTALTTTLQNRVFHVAPGSADMASAGTSTAFNVGLAAGALTGGLLLPEFGVRSTPLVGAVVTGLAFVVVLSEPVLAAPRRSSYPGHDPCAPLSPEAARTAAPGSTPGSDPGH